MSGVTLELFAGAGLAHRGLPYPCIGFERDADALASSRAHGLDVREADLATTEGQRRVLDAALDHERVDVLWASPPCQVFSQAGKREGPRDSSRNGIPWTLAILRQLHELGRAPRRVVVENVRGLTFHRGGRRAPCARGTPRPDSCPRCYFETVLAELRALYTHVAWHVLDAADYGVPQHRRRVFILASEDRAWVEDPPEPTHGSSRVDGERELLPWRTMREALPHVDGEIIGGGANPRHAGDVRRYNRLTDRPSTRHSPPHLWLKWDAVMQRGRSGPGGGTSDEATPADEPSVAITGGSGGSSRPLVRFHDEQREVKRRRLTVRECALLQGLEDDPTLPGQSKKSRYRQVGNGVPPQVVRALLRVSVVAAPTVKPSEGCS